MIKGVAHIEQIFRLEVPIAGESMECILQTLTRMIEDDAIDATSADSVINVEVRNEEVVPSACEVCDEDYTEAEEELNVTNIGVVCNKCLDAIRSRGENVTVYGRFGSV